MITYLCRVGYHLSSFVECVNADNIKFYFVLGKIDDSERLRPEELNQQNIEALVAESNLVYFTTISSMHDLCQINIGELDS